MSTLTTQLSHFDLTARRQLSDELGFKAETLSCSESDPGKIKFLKQNYPSTSDLTATISWLTTPNRVVWSYRECLLESDFCHTLFIVLKSQAS